MSNEFDKEVAAKIADRAIAEAKKESEEKYGTDGAVILDWNTINPDISSDDVFKWEFTSITNTYTEEVKKELSKIEFYRQKVKQYEDVETLIQSIECELGDVHMAKLSLNEYANEPYYGYKGHLESSYNDMETTYKSCLYCLRDLLKRL